MKIKKDIVSEVSLEVQLIKIRKEFIKFLKNTNHYFISIDEVLFDDDDVYDFINEDLVEYVIYDDGYYRTFAITSVINGRCNIYGTGDYYGDKGSSVIIEALNTDDLCMLYNLIVQNFKYEQN